MNDDIRSVFPFSTELKREILRYDELSKKAAKISKKILAGKAYDDAGELIPINEFHHLAWISRYWEKRRNLCCAVLAAVERDWLIEHNFTAESSTFK